MGLHFRSGFFLFTGALLFGLTEFFFFVMDHKLQP
jgi:hypothetical protein